MKKLCFRIVLVAAAIFFAASVFLLTGCASFDITDLPEIPWEIIIPETPTNTVPGGATSETNDLPPVAEGPSILSADGHKASFLWDDTKTRTLNGTSPHITDGQFAALVDRCLANGDNCINLYVGYNKADGAGAGYSIYMPESDIGGGIDIAAVARIQKRMDYALARGLRIIGWIRADDSGAWAKCSPDRHKKLNEDCAKYFGSRVSLFVPGLELDEYSKVDAQTAWVSQIRAALPGTPIGVHYTSGDHSSYAMKTGADAYLVQYDGWFLSPEKVGNTTADLIRKTGGKIVIIACEYDKNSGSAKARAKGKEAVRRGAQGTDCGRGE